MLVTLACIGMSLIASWILPAQVDGTYVDDWPVFLTALIGGGISLTGSVTLAIRRWRRALPIWWIPGVGGSVTIVATALSLVAVS